MKRIRNYEKKFIGRQRRGRWPQWPYCRAHSVQVRNFETRSMFTNEIIFQGSRLLHGRRWKFGEARHTNQWDIIPFYPVFSTRKSEKNGAALSDILKKFNPDIFGYSTGTGSANVWQVGDITYCEKLFNFSLRAFEVRGEWGRGRVRFGR